MLEYHSLPNYHTNVYQVVGVFKIPDINNYRLIETIKKYFTHKKFVDHIDFTNYHFKFFVTFEQKNLPNLLEDIQKFLIINNDSFTRIIVIGKEIKDKNLTNKYPTRIIANSKTNYYPYCIEFKDKNYKGINIPLKHSNNYLNDIYWLINLAILLKPYSEGLILYSGLEITLKCDSPSTNIKIPKTSYKKNEVSRIKEIYFDYKNSFASRDAEFMKQFTAPLQIVNYNHYCTFLEEISYFDNLKKKPYSEFLNFLNRNPQLDRFFE